MTMNLHEHAAFKAIVQDRIFWYITLNPLGNVRGGRDMPRHKP